MTGQGGSDCRDCLPRISPLRPSGGPRTGHPRRNSETWRLRISLLSVLFRETAQKAHMSAGNTRLVSRKSDLAHAPSRVAGQTPENALPLVSSPSARNSLAPFGVKVKRKFGSSEIEMPPFIEKTRSFPW
jgi:hypothetical protein